jgi:murein DD-endopeptidase MepM/ murein hydrolase activator NlpD
MNRSRAYIALILVLMLTFSSSVAAFGATRADVDASRLRAQEAREAAAAAEKRAAELRTEAQALDETINGLQTQVRDLDPQIAEASGRTTRLRTEVEELETEIATKETEIADAKAEYEYEQTLLNERMLASYKQGGALIYLDLLLASKDVSDLIARTTLVQRVLSANNDSAVALIHTREKLEFARAEFDRMLGAASSKRAEAEAVEGNLRTLRSQRQTALESQRVAQSEKTALMEKSEAEADRWKAQAEEEEAAAREMEAQIRAAASRGSASKGSGVYTGQQTPDGVMAWPVPGGSLTSAYGWRTHPIFGSRRFHHGIDINRGDGVIVAAGDGEVITASNGWNGGYGNIVVIDHGDGVTTLYAHILAGGIKVSVGQQVVKGEEIALVGSTGYSTGPHLHFEVRVNGSTTDPMAYLR